MPGEIHVYPCIVTILFCSIMVSGIKILGKAEQTTRNHIIMSVSLALGLLVIISILLFATCVWEYWFVIYALTR